MLSWISKMLDRIFAVVAAVILMQFPMFIDQYSIRLSGHVDELNYQMQTLQQVAGRANKNLDTYIQKFLQNVDEEVAYQGQFLLDMKNRAERLKQSLNSLKNANVFTRPFMFLFKSDWPIVKSTLHSYQLGISFTLESFFFAILGVFLGYYLYSFFSSIGQRVVNGLKRAKLREETHQP